MPWYAVGALAGALAPFAIWFSDFRTMLREGGFARALGFYAEALLISEPIAIAGAFLIDLVSA